MKIGIGATLHTITATARVGVAVVSGIGLLNPKSQVEQDRMPKTRNLTDVAYGVAAYFEGEERAGRLSRADAQGAAIRAVKTLRYDGQEYFWINDMQPRMVAHPMKPDLEGKDLSGVQDPTGKYLFRDFVDLANKQGQGFVDYSWPKARSKAPVPKRSSVRGFAPWAE